MGGDANIISRGRTASSASQSKARDAEEAGRVGAKLRRRGAARADERRRAAEDALLDAVLLPGPAPTNGVGADGQLLLMKALARLERQADVEAAVAWALDAGGAPSVLAAQPATAAHRIAPTPELYDALTLLERVQRLTDPDLDPVLTALGARGVSAAAPVAGPSDLPVAILLVHPTKPGRPLRPRSLAILSEVAAKLTGTLSTSLALERMSRLDGAVQRLDRLAALGGLVSEIVHELRNPLVSVKTFLQLLPERLEDPAFHGEFRGVVEDEVGRLERMLDDLLRHARPTPAHPAIDPQARVREAIQTTLQLLTYRCRERGIQLETKLDDALPPLGLPEDALRQLLLNLISNAAEVTPAGGVIRVEAEWSLAIANHVELRVEDDGPGLDPAERRHLFEPFWTTRGDGVGGLGLPICKRIVEQAGGQIEIEDGRERGACFRVSLPIAD